MKTWLLTTALLASTWAHANTIPEGKYNIDPAHSKMGFEVPHLVISTVEGRFTQFSGTLVVDKKLEKSKADIKIETASIDTANKDRDDHLRSPDFFNAKENPNITFTAKKITGSPENLKITGDLKIKSTTKPVTLDAKYLGKVKDAYGNDKIAFTASTQINRKDFGITWGKIVEAGPVVGDTVTLKLQIQAALEKAAK